MHERPPRFKRVTAPAKTTIKAADICLCISLEKNIKAADPHIQK